MQQTDQECPIAEMESWQVVPENYEEVCDWAYVGNNEQSVDRTRTHLLLYNELEHAGRQVTDRTVYPVTLRVQGFLSKFNLACLGNWQG